MANVTEFSYKTRASVKYPDVPSVSKPVPHDPVTSPVPTATADNTVDEETQEERSLSSPSNDSESDYRLGEDIRFKNNAERCDLVRRPGPKKRPI
ncbi:MAG: hypothetical protein ACEY3F_03940 [Wolbachia sp.]